MNMYQGIKKFSIRQSVCCSCCTVVDDQCCMLRVCLFVQHGETALHFAASGGHLNVIQLLCEKGMNVNARDKV